MGSIGPSRVVSSSNSDPRASTLPMSGVVVTPSMTSVATVPSGAAAVGGLEGSDVKSSKQSPGLAKTCVITGAIIA